MAVRSNLQATLSQEPTRLFVARFVKTRLTVTGIAGEFATIPLQVKSFLPNVPNAGEFFEGTEVELSLLQTFGFATILAKAPPGVGSLDIVYEVRTRADA